MIHNNPTIQTAEKIKVTIGQQSQNAHGRETEGLDRTTQRRKKTGSALANPSLIHELKQAANWAGSREENHYRC
jgi:hypothetical protein